MAYPIVQRKRKLLDLSKPYITEELRSEIRLKHRLQKKYNKYPITYGTEYRNLRNHLNKKLDKAKFEYFRQKVNFSKSNVKNSWNVVSEVLGRSNKKTTISELTHNGSSVTDPVEICNLLNSYFSSIGPKLDEEFINSNSYMNYLGDPLPSSFKFSSLSLDQLFFTICSLKNSAPGFDDIPMAVYKENFDILGGVILHVCNESLRQGIFPEQLKVGKVMPVLKSGDSNFNSELL